MALSDKAGELFQGFSKLSRKERLARLIEMGALQADDVRFLNNSQGLDASLAENFIENVIGYFPMPLGVATNFCIDGDDYVIPMAVEETSIIAAASKTAKWIRQSGEITTSTLNNEAIGQIQIGKIKDYEKFERTITTNKEFLIESANLDVAKGLVARGGGIRDLTLRKLPRGDGGHMAVIHIMVDTCDAMGANIVNQICEFLKAPLENLSGESVTMCILSNLVDTKLTQAKVVVRNIDPELGHALSEASIFAEQDPYRAATNNKGVLNGIDPILLATGNDWRAVEAGVHAYATQDGQYRSITRWRMQDNDLVGTLTAPIIVGTVGGMTKLHPTAQLGLRLLGVSHANNLARICAAVGLVQNLGAIRALSTVGIIQGHMKLHIANLTMEAGAEADEVPILKKRLEEILHLRKRISLSNAIEILKELRSKNDPLPSNQHSEEV